MQYKHAIIKKNAVAWLNIQGDDPIYIIRPVLALFFLRNHGAILSFTAEILARQFNKLGTDTQYNNTLRRVHSSVRT